jgi:hypothetical protein
MSRVYTIEIDGLLQKMGSKIFERELVRQCEENKRKYQQNKDDTKLE